MFTKKALLTLVVGATATLSASLFAQTLTYGAPITIDAAKKIAAAASAEAKKQNLSVVISIVDSSGTLTYLEKLDGTQLASVDVATRKARTANNFKRPTKVLEDAAIGGRNLVLSLPDALVIEGGLPIVVDNKILGTIGVSGASSLQDGQIAQAGLASLSKK